MKKTRFLNLLTLAVAGIMGLSLSACSDSEEVSSTTGVITIASEQLEINVGCDDTWYEVPFTSRAVWKATLTGGSSWVELKDNSGTGGANQQFGISMSRNTSNTPREALIELTSLGDKIEIHVTQAASQVETMDPSQIANYDKYYLPNSYNEYFEGGAEAMLRSDAQYSWWRCKQSEHFFLFWAPGFGDDPNSDEVDAALRVDTDDLLEKAEQFYRTNVEKLKMVTVGEGKSWLDKYKMQIYLLYQTEWLATGSGYDDTIGALWVNPSTCQPVGSTIGHEIGHSFQFQCGSDKLMTGEVSSISEAGFRYNPGDGIGCGFWEQCAQWQSFQDYPEEAITQEANVNVWKANHHRSFNHEWQRYASYWLQYYWTQKHGIEAFGRVWKESKYPEDPLQAYTRLFCNNDFETFYDEYYDYAARCVTYDFDAVHQYVNDNALNYGVTMLKNSDGAFQPAYSECPGTTGFNVIPLDLPAAGTKVSAALSAVAPGSALLSGDAGTQVDGDGKTVGNATTYNQQSNTTSCFRLGFVSVNGTTATYGTMAKGKDATAEFTVPADAEKLYLVVVATPTTYAVHPWDDDESNDLQWPYSVKFDGTSLKGFVDVDPTKDPESITLKYTLNCDATSGDYPLGTIDLSVTGDLTKICQAFGLTSTALAASTTSNAEPAEGTVAFCLLQPDGTIVYTYTANAGYYCKADGSVGSWGNDDPIYFEYDASTFVLTYGQKPGCPVAGTAYTVKPCFVYTKDGKQYTATFELTLQF